MNVVRRIVSGSKARYVNDVEKFDLDLVFLTDRLILMGYPAEGFESFYRNQRHEVKKFLSSLGKKYWIFNLCPLNENKYDPSYFDGNVSRFPFPDHFPPPLSLIPILVDEAIAWLNADPDNIIVIHCKAGKGRSGTMASSILLTLPGLPQPPTLHLTPLAPTELESKPHPQSDGEQELKQEVEIKFNSQPETQIPEKDMTMTEKRDYILDFHSSQRMLRESNKQGVSISSQRRWIGYYTRILDNDVVRTEAGSLGPKVRIDHVEMFGSGLTGIFKTVGGGNLSIQLFRYRDGLTTSLRVYEQTIKNSQETLPKLDTIDWNDDQEMLIPVGILTESGTSSPSETNGTARTLTPTRTFTVPSLIDITAFDVPAAKEQAIQNGVVLDGDREIQFRLLVGKTGAKHSKLPVMASLGVVWLIPSFETSTRTGSFTVSIPSDQIDFFKPQANLSSIEITFTWLDK